MKTKMLIQIIMAGLLLSLTGCLAPHGNQKQWDEGHWRGRANADQINQINQQRLKWARQLMAMDKLRTQPVTVGVRTDTGIVATIIAPGTPIPANIVGYKGIVENSSRNRCYNFRVQGPENPSFYLGPRQRAPTEICYLLPGDYAATIEYNGRKVGKTIVFSVGPQEKFFMGEKCHWYLVNED